MKSTINVTTEHLEGIIKELDESNFYNLSKTSRTDLFNFALALGLKDGTPTKLILSKGFIRTENEDVKPYFFLYKSIYYDKILSENEKDIDKITDIDSAFELVEQYANTGFYVLSRMKKDLANEELFTKKILYEINMIDKDYSKKYGVKTLYTE